MPVTSVAPEPRLGSARIWLELLVKKLGSARPIFQKARIRKFLLTRAYEKDHWHSTFLIEKIQVFLSTMAPEGNF